MRGPRSSDIVNARKLTGPSGAGGTSPGGAGSGSTNVGPVSSDAFSSPPGKFEAGRPTGKPGEKTCEKCGRRIEEDKCPGCNKPQEKCTCPKI